MVCVSLLGPEMVDQIYPLIVHVPLLLMLVFYYKFRLLPSLSSIFTAYLCCQCSNWIVLFVLSITGKEWCYYACRIVVTLVVFGAVPLCVSDDDNVVCEDGPVSCGIIGSLPLVYYILTMPRRSFPICDIPVTERYRSSSDLLSVCRICSFC